MFNYKSKLGNTQLDKNITTHQLIKLIKDNPQKELISQIRSKRSSNDKSYKELKGKLPVFGPNALFNNNLNQFNLITGTGCLYLDIDDCENYSSAPVSSRFTGINLCGIFLSDFKPRFFSCIA